MRCTFAGIVPGALHADGRRYLPSIILDLAATAAAPALTIAVIDRHHVVDQSLVGCAGIAQLVFLLSVLQLQQPPFIQAINPEVQPGLRRAATRLIACGQVREVPTWEEQREHLPYEALYTELVLDVGAGTVGVRTSATASSLASTIGKQRIEPGDWLCVRRSRVDILGFSA